MRWRPSASLQAHRARAAMMGAIRRCMADRNILEVTTPTLLQAPVTEPNIESLSAQSRQLDRSWYLRTSPEYPMKRLLCAGWPDIYEIGPVFRDGEIGTRHQPEFTMLEWYRHAMDLQAIIDDTTSLLNTALHAAGLDLPEPGLQNTYDHWLHRATGLTSDASDDELRRAAGNEVWTTLAGERDAVLGWLFDTHVASGFEPRRLTVVTHFPATQAALAQVDLRSDRALRFEVYCGATELANGFVELADAAEQRARFERDNAVRAANNQPVLPLDEPFLAALESGLPACAGVAVGIERVLMCALSTASIADVVSFEHEHHHAQD